MFTFIPSFLFIIFLKGDPKVVQASHGLCLVADLYLQILRSGDKRKQTEVILGEWTPE